MWIRQPRSCGSGAALLSSGRMRSKGRARSSLTLGRHSSHRPSGPAEPAQWPFLPGHSMPLMVASFLACSPVACSWASVFLGVEVIAPLVCAVEEPEQGAVVGVERVVQALILLEPAPEAHGVDAVRGCH